MSVFSGPNVVDDGLVFYYDISNFQKSWKGRPTTNLAASNFFSGNGNFTVNENITDRMPDGSTGVARLLNAQTVVDPNRTVSIGSYSLTAGETYTLSFYVRNINCTGFSGNLYSPTLLRVIGNITYPTLSANAWTRVITTFTVPNEGPNPVTLSPQVFRDGGFGIFKMCWLQMELGSAASQYVNGTRSDTQAILDLTNKNTITATSLTYASDGTFSFNGTNNYVQLPNSLGYSAEVSAFAWFRSTGSPTGGYHIIYGGQELEISIPTSGEIRTGVYTNSRYVSNHGSGLVDGNWHQVGFTFSETTKTSYIDGVFVGTQTTAGTLTSSFFNRTMGRFGSSVSYYLNGNISMAQMYNRPLSAAEIKQNFEATRGRYNV